MNGKEEEVRGGRIRGGEVGLEIYGEKEEKEKMYGEEEVKESEQVNKDS